MLLSNSEYLELWHMLERWSTYGEANFTKIVYHENIKRTDLQKGGLTTFMADYVYIVIFPDEES